MMQSGSGALSKALGDPAVDDLARRLHINLQDPSTLNSLLAMARQCVDESCGGIVAPKGLLTPVSVPASSRYERDAIRAYQQEIAAMA